MQANGTGVEQQKQIDVAGVIKMTIATLQSNGDQKRVSDIVYGWLKQFGIAIHEDAAEQLVGYLLALVEGARAGQDRPTDAEVRASLEARNRFAEEHNAVNTTTKLSILDLAKLPEKLVN